MSEQSGMQRRSKIRQANAIIAVAMLALFLIHGVGNALQLIGVGSPLSKRLSDVLLVLCIAHMCIGIYLTIGSLRSTRKAGVSYPAENRRLMLVRVSGVAIAALIAFHAVSFIQPSHDPVRLSPFGTIQLIGNVALVLAIAIHELASMHPLMISLGIPAPRARAADVAIVLSGLLILMAVGFIVYYLRWAAI